MLRQLNHPNILKPLGQGKTGQVKLSNGYKLENLIFVLTEYVDGRELFYHIKDYKLSEKHVRMIFEQILDALEYLQKKSICHRDIKPENIIIDKDHNIKIIDFGLSAFQDRS